MKIKNTLGDIGQVFTSSYADDKETMLATFSRLNVSQQTAILNSKQLNQEYKNLLATTSLLNTQLYSFESLNQKMSGGEFQRILNNAEVTKNSDLEKQILISAKLADVETAKTLTYKEVTKEQLLNAMAGKELNEVQTQNILSALNMKKALGSQSMILTSLKNSVKGLGAELKALGTWFFTTPAGWITIAIGALTTFMALSHNAEKQIEEDLENARQAFDESAQEIEDLHSQLTDIQDKIDALNGKPSLTLIEQNELEKLKEANRLLNEQLDAKNKQQLEKAENLSKENRKNFIQDFSGSTPIEQAKYASKQYGISNITGYINTSANPASISDMIVRLMAAEELYAENAKLLLTEKNQYIIEDLEKQQDTLQEGIQTLQDDISNYDVASVLGDLSSYSQNLNDISQYRILTQDEQDMLKDIETWQKTIYEFTDPQQWQTLEINDIFNTFGIEKTKEELIEMASSGELTPETISSYKNLNDALSESNLILGENQTAAEAFIDELKSMAQVEPEDYALSLKDIRSELESNVQLAKDYQKGIGGYIDTSTYANISSQIEQLSKESGMSIDNWVKKFSNLSTTDIDSYISELSSAINFNSEDISGKIVSIVSSTEALKNALTEQSEQGYITSGTFQELIKTNSAYADSVEYTATGLQLNMEKVQKISETTSQGISESIEEQKEAQVKLYQENCDAIDEYVEKLKESDDFSKRLDYRNQIQALQESNEQIKSNIDTLNDLEQQYKGVTSAYKQLQDALSTPNDSDPYFQILSNWKTIEDLYKKGVKNTDEQLEMSTFLTGKSDSSKKQQETVLDRYFNEENLGQADRMMSDLVEASKLLNVEWATFNKKTGEYKLNIGDMDIMATGLSQYLSKIYGKDVNVGTETIQTVLKALNDRGGNFSFGVDTMSLEEIEGLLKQIEDGTIKLKPEFEKQAVEELEKEKQELLTQTLPDYSNPDLSGISYTIDYTTIDKEKLDQSALEAQQYLNDLDNEYKINIDLDTVDLDSEITKVQDYISSLHESDGTLKADVDDTDLEAARTILADLIKKKQELEQPVAIQVSDEELSLMDQDAQDLIGKLQTFASTYQDWQINVNLGNNDEAIDQLTTLNDLRSDIDGTDAEVKAKIGFVDSEGKAFNSTSIDNMYQRLLSPLNNAQQTIDITINTDTTAADQAINDFKISHGDETVTLKIAGDKTKAEQAADAAKTYIESLNPKVPISASTSGLRSAIQSKLNENSFSIRINPVYSTPSGSNSGSGGAGVNGTAHSTGTLYSSGYPYCSSYAKGTSGNWGVSQDETALVNELGEEILVRDGRWHLIQGGAQFVDLKRGDIIFNHKQTEDLLSKGYITGRGTLKGGYSHVDGTIGGSSYAGSSIGNSIERALNAVDKVFKNAAAIAGTYKPSKSKSSSSKKSSSSSRSSKSSSSSKSSKSEDKLSKSIDNLQDWVERYIDVTERQIDSSKTLAEYYNRYATQNKYLENAISSANKLLSKNTSMYNEYMKQANSVGLSSSYKTKVQNGTIDVQKITDEKLKDKISEYQEWYDKAQDVKDMIVELNSEIRDLNNQKLDNIVDDFDRYVSLRKQWVSRQESKIEYYDMIGKNVSESTYNPILKNLTTGSEYLRAESQQLRKQLDSLMASGAIKKYTDDWYVWTEKIDAVNEEMYQTNIELEKTKDIIRELRWEKFNESIDTLDFKNEELEDLRSYLSSDGLFEDDGSLTSQGAANITILGMQIANSQQKLADYNAALKKLDQEYKNGVITQDEYTEQQREFLESIRESANAVYDYKQELIDMYKTQITAENNALKENIDRRKEALSKKKEYYEYDKTIRDKNKDIDALKAQISALEGVTNQAGQAELARLKAQLAEQEEDLEDTKKEHSYDLQTDAYDQLTTVADEALDKTLKELQTNAEFQKQVVDNMLSYIKTQYKNAYDEISKIISNSGITLDSSNQNTINGLGGSKGQSNANNIASNAQKDPDQVNSSSAINGVNTGKISGTNEIALKSLKINKSSATVYVGSTITLSTVSNPSHIKYAVYWKSSNTKVATVSATGVVKGISAGTATITVSSENKSATCRITVKKKTTSSSTTRQGAGTVTAKSGLNLRASAGTSGKLITTLPKGTKVTITGETTKNGDKWYKVKANGKTGYVHSDWIKVTKKYGHGVKNISNSQLAWTQDQGREIIVSKSDGSILTPLKQGDSVLPNKLTENLFDWGKISPKSLLKGLSKTMVSQQNTLNNKLDIHYDSLLTVNGNIDKEVYPNVKQLVEKSYQYTKEHLAKDLKKMGIK